MTTAAAIVFLATCIVLLLIIRTYRRRIAELERVEKAINQIGRIDGLNGRRNVEEIE